MLGIEGQVDCGLLRHNPHGGALSTTAYQVGDGELVCDGVLILKKYESSWGEKLNCSVLGGSKSLFFSQKFFPFGRVT